MDYPSYSEGNFDSTQPFGSELLESGLYGDELEEGECNSTSGGTSRSQSSQESNIEPFRRPLTPEPPRSHTDSRSSPSQQQVDPDEGDSLFGSTQAFACTESETGLLNDTFPLEEGASQSVEDSDCHGLSETQPFHVNGDESLGESSANEEPEEFIGGTQPFDASGSGYNFGKKSPNRQPDHEMDEGAEESFAIQGTEYMHSTQPFDSDDLDAPRSPSPPPATGSEQYDSYQTQNETVSAAWNSTQAFDYDGEDAPEPSSPHSDIDETTNDGPASPDAEGPASPDAEGLASPDEEGPASPEAELEEEYSRPMPGARDHESNSNSLASGDLAVDSLKADNSMLDTGDEEQESTLGLEFDSTQQFNASNLGSGALDSKRNSSVVGDTPSSRPSAGYSQAPHLGEEDEHNSSADDLHIPDDEENLDGISPEQLIESLERLEGKSTSDRDAQQPEAGGEVGELIADIFGENEDGEFTGFDDDDLQKAREAEQAEAAALSDAEDEVKRLIVRRELPPDFEYDFDIMMRKKREEKGKRRRRNVDSDIVNDSDDMIESLLDRMKEAAKSDRTANELKMPATSKRKLLPKVLAQLKKSNLRNYFVDHGVLQVIADWLSPLPDKNLPSLEIRTELLKVLSEFPVDTEYLKDECTLGKTVMYLYKHPRETKQNKRQAQKLIADWARPIFQISTDYRTLSKEEREARDYEHMSSAKRKRLSTSAEEEQQQQEESGPRPGEKGWIGRARVPRPSMNDYVVRPKWNVEGSFKEQKKRKVSRYDLKFREFKEKTGKVHRARTHAVSLNISGSNRKL